MFNELLNHSNIKYKIFKCICFYFLLNAILVGKMKSKIKVLKQLLFIENNKNVYLKICIYSFRKQKRKRNIIHSIFVVLLFFNCE